MHRTLSETIGELDQPRNTCLNDEEQTAYSKSRTEHLLLSDVFPYTVQVSLLLVHSVLQTVYHLLFVSPVPLYQSIR